MPHTDFKQKAELFNPFFSKQCSFISNDSSLTSYINYTTEKHNCTSVEDIGEIFQNFDFNKTWGHDNICMLNICSESIYKPLVIIFRQAPPTDMFSRKNSSLTQKSDKQNVKNHHSISVLPICSQIFQRLIFNEMFNFFISNSLILPTSWVPNLGFMYQPSIIDYSRNL